MADGNVINGVKKIICSDKERRFIVVSAPGKRYSGDSKVTDILYDCQKSLDEGKGAEPFARVRARFVSLVKELNIDFDIQTLLDDCEREIIENNSVDFTASRGEYLSAQVVAAVLGAKFIDSKDVIFFTDAGALDEERTNKAVRAALSGVDRAVFPGFYGTGADGKIKTFSRGGSDITGAIVARAASASLYENWTDVSGFLACDPRIVESPKRIKSISYKELRELSYMGANVLHGDSIFPVRKANIPIQIKNTFRPEDEGTSILPSSRYSVGSNIVTGVAGKKDFTVIFIEKSHMNAEVGFIWRILQILADEGVSVEHIPTGIDTLSLVIESAQLSGDKLGRIVGRIKEVGKTDVVRITEGIALVAVVGFGMSSSVGTSARAFNAVAAAGINVKIIDQGSSEMTIIIGVKNEDYEKCIRALYSEFFKR